MWTQCNQMRQNKKYLELREKYFSIILCRFRIYFAVFHHFILCVCVFFHKLWPSIPVVWQINSNIHSFITPLLGIIIFLFSQFFLDLFYCFYLVLSLSTIVDLSPAQYILISVMLMDISTLGSCTKFFWLVWPLTLVFVIFSCFLSRSCLPNNVLLPSLIIFLLFIRLLRTKERENDREKGDVVSAKILPYRKAF